MKALEDVVLFKVDAEKGEGPELKEAYRVGGYPTYVLANSASVTTDRWTGYTKEHFLDTLADGLSDLTTIEEKQTRFAKSPTARDAAKIARYHGTRLEWAQAIELYGKANELGSDDYSYEIFEATARGARDGDFAIDDAQLAAKAVLAGDDAEKIVDVWHTMSWLGRKTDHPDLADPYIEPALAAAKRAEGMDKDRARLEIAHALRITGDKEKAVELKRASMQEGWKDDHGQLNEFSWWCFENLVNLEEAEALARRGIELAPPGADKAAILDTAAEICNARGNCDDAVELTKLAIENDPTRELYKKQLERFQNIRAASAN